MGIAVIFVMGLASCHQFYIALYQKAFIENMVQIGKVVSEKSGLNFCMYAPLVEGEDMTLIFNNTYLYIYSIR